MLSRQPASSKGYGSKPGEWTSGGSTHSGAPVSISHGCTPCFSMRSMRAARPSKRYCPRCGTSPPQPMKRRQTERPSRPAAAHSSSVLRSVAPKGALRPPSAFRTSGITAKNASTARSPQRPSARKQPRRLPTTDERSTFAVAPSAGIAAFATPTSSSLPSESSAKRRIDTSAPCFEPAAARRSSTGFSLPWTKRPPGTGATRSRPSRWRAIAGAPQVFVHGKSLSSPPRKRTW